MYIVSFGNRAGSMTQILLPLQIHTEGCFINITFLKYKAMGERGEGFSETSVKDTWTKPKGDGIMGGKWEWLGSGEWG